MRLRLAADAAILIRGGDAVVVRSGVTAAVFPHSAHSVRSVVDALSVPREAADVLARSDCGAELLGGLVAAGAVVPDALLDDLVDQHARTVRPLGAFRAPLPPWHLHDDTGWLLREAGAGPAVTLPPAQPVHMPLSAALAARRSVRGFTGDGIDAGTLATLLWWSAGAAGTGGRRTYPSGGSLLPVEVYVVPTRVAGLDASVRRYRPAAHALAMVGAAPAPQGLQSWFADVDATDSAVVILLAIDLGRGVWRRYGGKAYRLALLEAGHVAQNLLLVAAALELTGVGVCGLADDDVTRAIGLQPPEGVVVYAVVLGR